MKRNQCQEKGCNETENLVKCRLTIYKNDLYKSSLFDLMRTEGIKSAIEFLKRGYTDTHDYYCAEHCQKNGYCYGCGNFWAGSESFDFSKSGLCSNCQSEFEDDYFEPDIDFPGDHYP